MTITRARVPVLRLGVAILTLAMTLHSFGCASSSTSSPPTLQNSWISTNVEDTAGAALTLNPDQTYTFGSLTETSPTTFDAEIETGTYSVSGSDITFTPQKWTCQEPTDPPYVAGFKLGSDSLQLAFTSGILLYKVNTSAGSGSSTGLEIVDGCFLRSGQFVQSPLTPVGSCHVAGGDCASASATCCNGSACTNGGTCADTCTANAECKSGCCLGAVGTIRVCAPAADCK